MIDLDADDSPSIVPVGGIEGAEHLGEIRPDRLERQRLAVGSQEVQGIATPFGKGAGSQRRLDVGGIVHLRRVRWKLYRSGRLWCQLGTRVSYRAPSVEETNRWEGSMESTSGFDVGAASAPTIET